MFGNCIGRTPTSASARTCHHLNLFAAFVGETGKSRKGMSRNQAQQVWADVDEPWVTHSIVGGLSSGEGLIWKVRDPIEKRRPVMEKGRVVGYETVIEDDGVEDKRLLVIETEFASTLKVMAREGSTLSPVCRQAWDGHDLQTLTKNSAARASAPHISIVGHITADELRRYLDATETANGFGNRFLWLLVQRSNMLPEGGRPVSLDAHLDRLRPAVSAARRRRVLCRDAEARQRWAALYPSLSAGRPGMLGAMTARAEAQVTRLACLYALADDASVVGLPHLEAALALWRYCFASAAWLFGDRLGDPTADTILSRLKRLYPESVTRTEISQLFHRHQPASELERALSLLQKYQLAQVDKDRSADGRPVERWYWSSEISELSEITPAGGGDSSLISLNSHPTEPTKRRGADVHLTAEDVFTAAAVTEEDDDGAAV